jgi:hypothetical protein
MKRRKAVKAMTPPKTQAEAVNLLHGFMRGSVIVPEGVDLTAPVYMGEAPRPLDSKN